MSDKLMRDVAERLLSVDWTDEDKAARHAPSRSRLFREYLRRLALQVERFEGEVPDWPYTDLVRLFSPEKHAEGSGSVEQIVREISDRGAQLRVEYLCRSALHWARVKNSHDVINEDLPDPFEPLLMLFERGGGFVVENGVADFEFIHVRLGRWQDHVARTSVTSLDESALRELDDLAD
ncbi:hypothetical protein [Streptomyces sp. NPDC057702]|uniref:hypothetical protein n=1 Tax=unclassified Streptomyces TaxID=2593676 RepID=UPI0036A1ADD0